VGSSFIDLLSLEDDRAAVLEVLELERHRRPHLQGGDNLKRFEKSNPKAKARIWP